MAKDTTGKPAAACKALRVAGSSSPGSKDDELIAKTPLETELLAAFRFTSVADKEFLVRLAQSLANDNKANNKPRLQLINSNKVTS